MRRITQVSLLLAVLVACVGGYYWAQFAGTQCEPCLPTGPCPPCPSEYATPTAIITISLEVLILGVWMAIRSRATR